MSTRLPLVSVLMAVHNGEPFLRAAIDSILAQTLDDFEFIIVDDASTDASAQILAGYRDARLRLLANPHNLGLTASLNLGLKIARGQFVARQDADDLSLPERFRRQVDFLQAHPAVGAVGTGYQIIDAGGRTLEDVHPLETNAEIQHRLESANAFVHSSLMLRQSLLIQVGGYREYFRMSQDYDLALRIAECAELANLPDRLVSFRVHPASGSRQRQEQQLAYKQLAWRLAEQRRSGLPEGPLPQDLLAECPPDPAQLFIGARGVSYLYYAAGQAAAAEEMVRRAAGYQAAGNPPASLRASEWAEWLLDRAHRLAAARADVPAGAQYLAWMLNLLQSLGLPLPEKRLTAEFYAGQAFAGHQAGDARNALACATQAVRLHPAWLRNPGLARILLKSLAGRGPAGR